MLMNGGNTEGLFRAAFMQSGSPINVGDSSSGQPFYDGLVNYTDCGNASDTLDCLRNVSEEVFQDAVNAGSGKLLGHKQSSLKALSGLSQNSRPLAHIP